ncbi:MAG: 5-formyltetrahydrofolate cyclo-ligase [Ardenticatenaceae bacterium]|nr:5-formyltetrahydrofolate cyclo-ligase [Ardenticatenaceae bacterium]MCB9445503.1 5-formyltetrahydrofolate cyclo-ligase [Ardenticatenaceae bacterium]
MNQSEAREHVWSELIKVAKPDSRFHLNFKEFIPDFAGSEDATKRLTNLDIYQNAKTIFITPDNCLENLRAQTLRDNKTQIITTYGIRRGFVVLERKDVPSGFEDYAVLLDAIEGLGKTISLQELKSNYSLDLIVTGASAVNYAGVRFGKGHGFFDLEWAMFYQLGIANQDTPIVAFVHDYQLVNIDLSVNPFDTLCDYIVTPTQTIHVPNPQKPDTGVIWEKLEPGMFNEISPLRELKEMERLGQLT